jgi:hypothetical protein
MFRSMLAGKSRHKVAIMAGALVGVLTPLAAQASLTISLQLAPGAAGATKTVDYLTPDNNNADVPVYVYATVQGTTSVTAGTSFQGFQYAYYNINFQNVQTSIAAALDTGTTSFNNVNTAFNFNALGSYKGSTANTGAGILAGSTTTISDIAHARNNNDGPVWSNATAAGNNLYVSPDGKSVSFLIETLEVKPTAFKASTTAANGQNYTKFTASAPIITGLPNGLDQSSANWNEDSTSTTGNGAPITNIKNTQTGTYGASSSFVTFEDTIAGDATGDGQVGSGDLVALLQHYGVTTNLWSQGSFLAATGHAGTDPTVDANDLVLLLQNYNQTLIPIVPMDVVADSALLADPQAVALLKSYNFIATSVPEPMSLGMMGLAGVVALSRRRRRI